MTPQCRKPPEEAAFRQVWPRPVVASLRRGLPAVTLRTGWLSPPPWQLAHGQSAEIQPDQRQPSASGAVFGGLTVRRRDVPNSGPHVNPEPPRPSVHTWGAGRGGSQGALCMRQPPYLALHQDGDLGTGWRREDRCSVSWSHSLWAGCSRRCGHFLRQCRFPAKSLSGSRFYAQDP